MSPETKLALAVFGNFIAFGLYWLALLIIGRSTQPGTLRMALALICYALSCPMIVWPLLTFGDLTTKGWTLALELFAWLLLPNLVGGALLYQKRRDLQAYGFFTAEAPRK